MGVDKTTESLIGQTIFRKYSHQVELERSNALENKNLDNGSQCSANQIFTGDEKGNVKYFDVDQHREVASWGTFHYIDVHAVAISPDRSRFWLSEYTLLQQFTVRDLIDFTFARKETLVPEFDYGDIAEDRVTCIVAVGYGDETKLFTGDKSGALKEWSVSEKVLIKDHGVIHDSSIMAMQATKDGKFQYTGCKDGVLNKLEISKQEVWNNFGKLHDGWISAIHTSFDNKYIFTCGRFGYVRQWSVDSDSLEHDYGHVHDAGIMSTVGTPDDQFLFTCDIKGELRQWSIPKKELVKDYGKIHSYPMQMMHVSFDGRWLFTSDRMGYMKQWSVEDKCEVMNYGKIHEKAVFKIEVPNLPPL